MTLKTHSGFGMLDTLQQHKSCGRNGALRASFNSNTGDLSPGSRFLQAQLPPDLDLEGGTLLSSEEIDPEDNCKIQVKTYRILSADRTEESTITKRRKLKVNCTQSLKRVEFTNGKEAKFEEKTTVLDNIDALRKHPVGRALAWDQPDHAQDRAISDVLMRTQDTFLSLLNEKKEQLVKMFPELFSNLRTQPAIFEAPSTIMETFVNADGSTTTRTKSSKAFSSHYSRQETFLNGEYAGPEGGFCIKLNDNADEDLSEEENDMDDSNDSSSRISRSGLSEIPDTVSALVSTHGSRGIPKLSAEPMKRWDKAWHAVNELVESEGRYVQKLGLLEKFREEVEKEKLLDKKQMAHVFANISSLYRFHNDHLLPQLMDRHREWQSTKRISDVLRKQAPFLKMYSEYTNNYKKATQMFEECMRKRKFEEIVRRLESTPECENLSLMSHLICPVQRVMRYQLLLKEYQKNLHESDGDYTDTEIALSLVLEAASHANEMMRKLDRYRNVLEAQEQLGNVVALVSPSRELLKKAKLSKISSSTNRAEERFLFVFNDLFLLASERSIGIGSKYKLRAIFDAYYTQICEGDNFEREHSFYLRGSDSQSGPSRCVELFCSSQAEKNDLFETMWAVIEEVHVRRNNSSSLAPNIAPPRTERKCCARCDVDFTWYMKSRDCSRCTQKYCKKCFGHLKDEPKPHRICMECIRSQEGSRSHFDGLSTLQSRKNLLATPAKDGDIIKASYVTFRGPSSRSLKRYFVLRKNCCLYSYKSENEQCASAMLPMAGCDVAQSGEKLTFTIRHMSRNYYVTAECQNDFAEWMAALILAANAKLPTEDGEAPIASSIKRSASMGLERNSGCRQSNGKSSLHTLRLPTQYTHM
ncbi:rhoGEF domain-containing protein [Ditylenchus destructor]|nr:rhoGEF domain-containing protein [Ditylenchus destructor]